MSEERILNLDACIKCSACTAYCPVAQVYPPYLGPKAFGPDEERFRLEGFNTSKELLSYCSNCKTCEVTCPSGVKITDFILAARGKGKDKTCKVPGKSLRIKTRDLVLGRAEYLGVLGSIWPGLTNGILKSKAGRWILEKGLGVERKSPLPRYGKKLTKEKTLFSAKGKKDLPKKKVLFFPGCFIKYNDADTGRIAVKVLEYNGFEVIMPKFRCCGAPLEGNGYFSRAEKNARHNLSLMKPYFDQGIPVVCPCTSCSLSLKEYSRLNYPGAEQAGILVYDLFEFLWECREKNELNMEFKEVKTLLGYHAPCHLKAQGIGTPSVRLLREIPGVQVQNFNSSCCGLSGSFGFKKERYALGMAIGTPLFEAVRKARLQTGIEGMLSECGGCRIQIEHGSGVKAKHPVWVLAEGYGIHL